MFLFKNEDCERRKHYLSDGRQLEEVIKEIYSGGAASGGIHCLAEKNNLAQDGVTGKAESFRICQCTSTKQICCMTTHSVQNLVRVFSNETKHCVGSGNIVKPSDLFMWVKP